jgi:CRP-like cAMP-binding protein
VQRPAPVNEEASMKFAARDGSTARTLAVTSPGWFRGTAPAADPRPASPIGRLSRVKGAGYPGAASNGSSRAGRTSTVTFAKGQELFGPGRGQGLVYIVRSGCIRLYKTLPDGRSINLGLLGPNTVFAQEDHYDGLSTGATAEALVDSSVTVVDAGDLAAVIAESPELATAVVDGMTRRLTELQMLAEHLLVRDTSVRLATTLLTLAKGFGRPTADGMTAITLPLTHQGLANMIGSNRVTVTRKLMELQERGIVRSLGRNALAVDPDALRGHAQAASEEKDGFI